MSTLKYSNDSVNLLDIMCRSCLVSSDNMKQIFSDNESEDLIFLLSTCGGIKVSKSDGLPSALCHECFHELQQAFSFRTKCQNSNKILYDWLATQHTEKGESVAADNSNILIFCLSKEKIGSPEPSDTKENNALLDSTITSIENVLPILSKTKEEDTLFCDYACKTNESFLNSSLEISKSPAQESSKLSDDDLPLIHVLQKLGKNVTKKPTKEKTEIKKIVKRSKSNNRERCNSLSERDSSIEYRVANNSCYICSENFPTLDSLNAHKTVHYFYKCVKCKTRFKSMQEFRSHKCSAKQNKTNSQMNTKVKNRDSTSSIDVRSCKKIFWCTVCERGLTCGRSLKYHLRSHTGEKPHLCMVCGKTFREQRSLDNHVRAVHTCEKKFVCAFCPKAFSVSGKKRQHERTHTGEKPYQCPVCCRLFAARSTLNNHVRRHTHEIKFPCKVVGCGQGFYSFSTYQRHMWSHSGERPYQCTLCPKAYLSGQNLRSHTRAAHLQLRDQVCHLCKKEFTERSTLNRHIRSIHKSEPKVNKPVAVFGFPDESPCTLEGTTHSPVEDAVHQDFSDVT